MTKITNKTYLNLINNLKSEIKTARVKAHLAVNQELILLYFRIGKKILEKQRNEGWGTKVTQRISYDLSIEFPDMKGLSYSNIRYMQRFFESCISICPQLVGKLDEIDFFKIPWGHNREIIDSVKNKEQRLWYANQAIENGWSRNVLMHQIKSDLYDRQVKSEKTHNFDLTLPDPQSDLAVNLLKDQYNFEFLRGGDFKEKELEDGLTDNIVKFLLELGKGFAFIGRQYNINIGGQDFFIDLLFYNIELRCFVVIELKTGEFKPEYTGKLGFYLSIIDEQLKKDHDQNTIGMILCTKNNKEISKHSVRYMMKPIGVSEYKIAKEVTDKKIKEIIPSAVEIEDI